MLVVTKWHGRQIGSKIFSFNGQTFEVNGNKTCLLRPQNYFEQEMLQIGAEVLEHRYGTRLSPGLTAK